MKNAHVPGKNLIVKSSLILDPTQLTSVEQALFLAQENLQTFTSEPDFSQKMAIAFGEGANVDSLRTAWSANDFSDFPKIEIRDAADINGANGAFAAATNKIYLSQEFIINHQEDVDAIARVLLEEFGHFVDSQLNEVDSPGDEGAIFSSLVKGDFIDEKKLHQLKIEDDTAQIILDGHIIEIEQDNFSIGTQYGGNIFIVTNEYWDQFSVFKIEDGYAQIDDLEFTVVGTAYSRIGGVTAPLFSGKFSFYSEDIRNSVSDQVETGSFSDNAINSAQEFKLVGLDVNFSKLALKTDQIQLQGEVLLPYELSGSLEKFPITFVDLIISQTDVSLTGENLKLPENRTLIPGKLLEIKIENANLALDLKKNEGTIQGRFTVPTLDNATLNLTGNNYIAFKEGTDGLNLAMIAEISVAPIPIFGTEWGLQNITVNVDKQFGATGTVKAKAELKIPEQKINFDLVFQDGKLAPSEIQLPSVKFGYENLFDFDASNLKLRWDQDSFIIQGNATGNSPFLNNATFNADFNGSKYIKVSNSGIDAVGTLSLANIAFLGNWGLNQALVNIDTINDKIIGTADIQLPWGLIRGLQGTLDFQKGRNGWQLNSAEIESSGNLPLPIIPLISLQKIKGKVINLSQEAQSRITFNGGVTFAAKPLGLSSISTILPDWVGRQFVSDSVGIFTLDGSINQDRLLMNGNVNLIGGLLSGSIPNLNIDWHNLSLASQINAEVLNGLIKLNAGFVGNSNLDFTIFGEGKVTIPNIDIYVTMGINGIEILSAGAGVKFINNNDLSDDSVAGWGSIFPSIKVGYQVSLDGKTDIIGAEEIESYKQKTLPAEGSISLDRTFKNNQVSLLNDFALSQVLASALPTTYSYLQQFSTSPEFSTTMNLAFGNSWNTTTGNQIAQAWALGNFDTIPAIKILPAANIGDANAAFADSTNTIYLAKEYLTYHASDLNSITDVLLEEIGHWVDAQVNLIDAPGDEGAIFSSLVRHQTLNEQQLAQLKVEDDTLTITLDATDTQLNLNFSQEDSFSIALDTPWLLLAVNWKNEASSAPVEIQAPNGKIYTESDLVDNQTIVLVNELGSLTRKVVRIDKPEAGIWKIKLPDASSLGKVEFSALGGLEAPQMAISELKQELNSSNVIINYEISNIDSNAQITFYYDTDNQGFDGIRIGEVNPQTEGSGKYVWNTEGIDLSQYYVYALVFDDNRIPTSAYSLKSVNLKNPPVNNAPILINAIANQTATEDTTFSFTFDANTFNDVDAGDSLNYKATLGNGNPLPTWLNFNAATRTFSGTPTNGDVGTLSLKLTTTDIAGASSEDIFDLQIINVNDAPIAADDTASTNQNTPLTLSITNLLANDSDIDGNSLRITAVSNATNGSVVFNTQQGNVVFTPVLDFSGAASFNYTVSDGNGGTSTATVAVTVNPSSQPNEITGTPGRDTLTGTSKSDRITGFQGADTLTGGGGNDQFVYTNIRDRGDTITDFEVGKDNIVFTELLDSLVTGGYKGTNAIADGYVKVVQGNSASNFSVQIDADGPTGNDIFRPFITVNLAGTGTFNNASNFVF
ncbi:cadherin-like domain-containing protein [Nostoc sp. NMS8]|uniref:Ig-like domain-containing protein n=1 Tax=Nostoc sp. NMS8 TaxID=2815392 RepID=UPI002601419A|nr:cadherin-like domain-containing protein [Nostoc sp. NMS8]MBN3957445.1 cadherin-like domain-containing protein [Nostoc sp. NMS8]